jgi:hypothetical protein
MMQGWKFAGVALGAAFAWLVSCAADAGAAELKIFGSRVTKVIVGELGPGFEKATGLKPVVVAAVAAVMKRRIEGG